MKQYSAIFDRNLKSSFIVKLRRLHQLDKKYDEILDLYRKIAPGEVEYFRMLMIDEIVHGSFTVGKEGIFMKPQEHKVSTDENGQNWRLG